MRRRDGAPCETRGTPGAKASRCSPALPHGCGRNTDNSGLGPGAPGDGDDHAEAVPQGRAGAARRRAGHATAATAADRAKQTLEGTVERVAQGPGHHVLLVQGRHRPHDGAGQRGLDHRRATASGSWSPTGTWNHRACTSSSARSSTSRPSSATPGVIEIINDYATASIDPVAAARRLVPRIRPRRPSRGLPGVGVPRRREARLPFRGTAEPRLLGRRLLARLGQLLRAARRRPLLQGAARGHEAELRLRADRQPHRAFPTWRTSARWNCPTSSRCASPSATSRIEGAAEVARQISNRYRDRNIRVLPVPMRIEDGEKEKLDLGRAYGAPPGSRAFPQEMSQADSLAYWAAVEVPYKPFYAFEEILATLRRRAGLARARCSRRSSGSPRAVTAGEVTAMPSIPRRCGCSTRRPSLGVRRPPSPRCT